MRDERSTEVSEGWLARMARLPLSYQDTDLAILHPAERMEAGSVVAHSPFRLLAELDLGDQVADRGIRPGKCDGGRLADQAATAVAADKIPCAQRPAIGCRDLDAGIVLGKPRHLTSAVDRYPQLVDPAGEYALDVFLPQGEPVIVTGGKVADVQLDVGEPRHLRLLPLGQEPIRNAALIQNLDCACMQAQCAMAGEVLAQPPLDDDNIDACQRQLTGQHQPCRAASGDNHCMLGHGQVPHIHRSQLGT